MRKLLSVFLLFIITFTLHAANTLSQTSFDIKAFKVNSQSDSPELVITDSMAESLEQINAGYKKIDITEDISDYLGNASLGISDFSSQIIFSYRCAWDHQGKYTIAFTMTPFTGKSSNYVIPAYFKPANFNYIFTDTATAYNESDFEISGNVPSSPDYSADNSGSASFSIDWNVGPTRAVSSAICTQWIARGAVAMTVDKTKYGSAPIDVYTSEVTVKLVVN